MEFECPCDIDIDIEDPVELIEQKIVKARKEHTCMECKGGINSGDKYEVQKYKSNGDFVIHRICSSCLEIREAYLNNGYYYGMIWENMRECYDDIPLSDFETFSPETQQKILEMM